MKIFAIACVDRNNAIGYQNKLIFNIKDDMAHFYRVTKDAVLILGRKTFESLPNGPLNGRLHVVVTRNTEWAKKANRMDNVTAVPTPEDALEMAKRLAELSNKKAVAVIGGESIYKALLPHCDCIYLTKVFAEIKHADAYFPVIPMSEFKVQSDSPVYDPAELLRFCFVIFERIKKSKETVVDTECKALTSTIVQLNKVRVFVPEILLYQPEGGALCITFNNGAVCFVETTDPEEMAKWLDTQLADLYAPKSFENMETLV